MSGRTSKPFKRVCRKRRSFTCTFRLTRPGRRAGPGTTLVELLLALTITSLIGAAIATMLFATSYGTSNQKEMRDVIVSNEVAATRLNAALRVSMRVLAKGDNYLVLWMADTRTNDEPDLSELRRIERNPATDELTSYRAPMGLAEADDATYEMTNADFDAVTKALKGSPNFPGTVWATDVSAWTTTADAINPGACCFVGFQVKTTIKEVSASKVGGGALRNH
jgi:hypothetical protein